VIKTCFPFFLIPLSPLTCCHPRERLDLSLLDFSPLPFYQLPSRSISNYDPVFSPRWLSFPPEQEQKLIFNPFPLFFTESFLLLLPFSGVTRFRTPSHSHLHLHYNLRLALAQHPSPRTFFSPMAILLSALRLLSSPE